jgi:hypothetical protein
MSAATETLPPAEMMARRYFSGTMILILMTMMLMVPTTGITRMTYSAPNRLMISLIFVD